MSQIRILGRARRSMWHILIVLLLAIGSLAGTSYGTTVDFEDLSLPANSFWDGSDGSGGFSSRGTSFNNSYNFDWYSWSGFSYSNVNYTNTSSTWPPGSDQTYTFAAVTGSGVGGSGNYAVGFGCSSCFPSFLPQLTIPAGMRVQSAMFTNTTYAAASMLHGDAYSKQFADGDWLKLTITGECAPGHVLGSVQFNLATDTSILEIWQSVDLSSLAGARTLTFDLTSTDNGSWGMNTPAFFAMDSLTLSPLLPGDFNLDGSVDGLDRDILMANAGLTGPTVTWRSGDANCDGVVNNLDRDIWFANAFRSLDEEAMPGSAGAIHAVPEPGTFLWAVAAVAGAAVLSRRSRTRLRYLQSFDQAP
jgi:hypothetical protein